MDTIRYEDVLSAVVSGALDGRLRELSQAIKDRHRYARMVEGQKTLGALSVGTKVRFTNDISPRYLAGLEAVVSSIARDWLRVQIPNQPRYGRYAGLTIRVAPSIVQPV